MQSRESFIESIIFELQLQKNDNISAFEKPKPLAPLMIFKKLCYDFPIISNEELAVLDDSLKILANDDVLKENLEILLDLKNNFCFDSKFIENIIFMSGTISECKESNNVKNKEEIAGSICSTLFIKFTHHLISCEKEKIITSFQNKYITLHIQKDTINNKENLSLLSWNEIMNKFHNFITKSSLSILSVINNEMLINEKYIETINKIISIFNPFKSHLNNNWNAVTYNNDNILIFKDILFFSNHFKQFYPRSDEIIKETINYKSEILSYEDIISISLKSQEIWIHCIFLLRDLMIQHPMILIHSLATVCDDLKFTTVKDYKDSSIEPSSCVFQEDAYPNATELLFALVLSSVCYSYLPPAHGPTSQFASTTHSMAVPSTLQLHKRNSQKVLKSYCISNFSVLVSICNRMSVHSDDRTEYITVLCDAMAFFLYCDVDLSVGGEEENIRQNHRVLATHRVPDMLVKWWLAERAVSSEGPDPAGRDSSLVERVLHLLAIYALQRAESAELLLGARGLAAALRAETAAAAVLPLLLGLSRGRPDGPLGLEYNRCLTALQQAVEKSCAVDPAPEEGAEAEAEGGLESKERRRQRRLPHLLVSALSTVAAVPRAELVFDALFSDASARQLLQQWLQQLQLCGQQVRLRRLDHNKAVEAAVSKELDDLHRVTKTLLAAVDGGGNDKDA